MPNFRKEIGASAWAPEVSPGAFFQNLDGKQFWSVGDEALVKPPGRGSAAQLNTNYGEKILAEADLLKQELGTDNLTPTQISNLRKRAGRVFINKQEYSVSGMRAFVREKNPSRLKFNLIDTPETQTGTWSANPTKADLQKRDYAGTGFLPSGEFAAGDVIRQSRRLTNKKAWPSGKSLEGFFAEINSNWNEARKSASSLRSETGKEHHAGHVKAAKTDEGILLHGGSYSKHNVVDQVGWATDPTGQIDTVKGVDYQANVPLQNRMFKDIDDLKMAGFGGFNILEAFNEYLLADDPKIIDYTKILTNDQRARAAHEVGVGAEASVLKFEKENLENAQKMEIAVVNYRAPEDVTKNPTVPDITDVDKLSKGRKPRALFNKIKNTLTDKKTIKNIAGVAGQSNNPLVNITGDLVGTVVDGVAFAANPQDKDAMIDLALSAGQLGTTIVAGGIALLPIPGARPGAFAVMKVGDNLGKIERLWGMSREGRNLKLNKKTGKPEIVEIKPAKRQTEADAIRTDLDLDATRSRISSFRKTIGAF